ncbi:phage major capsid protein [Amycolatopsis sp. NPDC051128]|uniref:phage major capsid protein n=1 Tax=Amycolatopsis sp. NPDC051128 TaxID=3155412 RepID=UPI00342E6271
MTETLRKQREIDAEIRRLDRFNELTEPQGIRYQELRTASIELQRVILKDSYAKGHVEDGTPSDNDNARDRWGGTLVQRGDPWRESIAAPAYGGSHDTVAELRGRARTAIERTAHAPDGGRDRITRALDSEQGGSLNKIAAWSIATSDPAYMRAFSKLAVDPMNGNREFTGDELNAFQRTQSLARAMSLTDASGGYLIPFQLDPTVILTSDGSTNPLRQIARTVVATGDVWNGVSSAGITAGWLAEAAENSDNAPTLAQPSINVYKQSAFVPVSVESYDDMANGAAEVTSLLFDAADQVDSQAFILGTGSAQPFGIVTALVGTASVVSLTGGTLDAVDFTSTQEALGPRFQPNAQWIMHLVSLNRGRSIIAGTGLTTPMIEGNPPILLSKIANEASYMDSTIAAGTTHDYLAVYGDFSNYVIADRIGSTVELVPHLFGANRRPSGQRGWWLMRRVGADSVNDAAFRMLDKSA